MALQQARDAQAKAKAERPEPVQLPHSVRMLYQNWKLLMSVVQELPAELREEALSRINKAGQLHLVYAKSGKRADLADVVYALTPKDNDPPPLKRFLGIAMKQLAESLLAAQQTPGPV